MFASIKLVYMLAFLVLHAYVQGDNYETEET